MSYTIGEVARLANISVRTLHYYDAVGLLVPTGRSDSGYRLYSHTDLERLQQILFYKALDFPLKDIQRIMTDSAFDRYQALLEQRDLIASKSGQLKAVLELIEKTIDEMNEERTMNKEEMFEVFGDFDPEKYEKEVEQRWGGEGYKETVKRTGEYTKEDWQQFKKEGGALNLAILNLMDDGVAPDDDRAIAAVDKCRLLIDRWFYPCSREMHANLGKMYVTDSRFTEVYDKIRPGMAQYICDAAEANYRKNQPM